MNGGWIKLYRGLLDNPIVMKDSDHLAIWTYLLLRAAHEETEVIFHGRKESLKPGELLTSYRLIGRELSISTAKVKRVIDTFKSETQIETRTDRQRTLISIVGWDKYQQSETRSEPRVKHEWNTSETQNKNIRIKELKNINNTLAQNDPEEGIKSDPIEERFEVFWKAYPKKTGKGAALKSFKKINPSEDLLKKMLSSIEQTKQTDQWKRDNGQYIPYPATWLNQGRWEDEVTVQQDSWSRNY